jgi:hypothetical protein
MKQLQALILAIAAAAGGWFARGTMLVPAPTGEHAAAPEGESKDEPGIKIDNGEIQLDPETAERLGIETLPVAALSWTSGVNAIGSVLDPAPLAALDGDIAAARSDLDAAQVELDRAEALFQNGENVPKKNVDTARAQLRAAQLKLQALLVRLPLEWGKLLETTDDTSRHALIERLVSRKAALIRIESVENSSLAAQATSAQLFAAGGSLTLERMVAAPSLNERTQAIAYLVLAVP